MDHDHPGSARVVDVSRLVGLSVEGERTLIRGLDSREDLHERALASAVFADHPMHFASREVEANAI